MALSLDFSGGFFFDHFTRFSLRVGEKWFSPPGFVIVDFVGLVFHEFSMSCW